MPDVSRAAVRITITIAVLCIAMGSAVALDPHLDPIQVPGSCPACHVGHGKSRSPMLPAPQTELCLSCHGGPAAREKAAAERRLGQGARPPDLSTALAQLFVHPMDDQAYSRWESGSVTCTSCHSPHRGSTELSSGARAGGGRMSARDPSRTEIELCTECHGTPGPGAGNPREIGALIDPRNRSLHAIGTPSRDTSPSVMPSLAGKEISCSDCHGNSDSDGVRGPHGSAVRSILRSSYERNDGNAESATTYSLCYGCHDRGKVLDSPSFPEHRLHVVGERTSCSTCHDAHGSRENRAMIRVSRRAAIVGVSPSGRTGELAFRSSGPGLGSCSLTCHGFDHGPAEYGGAAIAPSDVANPRDFTAPRVGAAERTGSRPTNRRPRGQRRD